MRIVYAGTLAVVGMALFFGVSCGNYSNEGSGKMSGPVKVGDTLPEFELPTGDGKIFKSSELRGGVSVLFFYPKDNTSICTKEVCLFRDSYEAFTENGAKVYGISSDTAASHQKFSEENKLPYPLLSDEGGKVRALLGVPRTLGVAPGRVTYVIDKAGVVRLIFNSQLDAQAHVDEALALIKKLAGEVGGK